jgi:hypothetical protein
MTIQRMDSVLIVVDNLEAATAFFAEMELGGEAPVEGRWVDRVVGLNDVRALAAGGTSGDAVTIPERLEVVAIPREVERETGFEPVRYRFRRSALNSASAHRRA